MTTQAKQREDHKPVYRINWWAVGACAVFWLLAINIGCQMVKS